MGVFLRYTAHVSVNGYTGIRWDGYKSIMEIKNSLH